MPSESKILLKRVGVELAIGLVLVGLLSYHLYFRFRSKPATVELTDPQVQQEIKGNSGKVLLIGLDGATWDVIFPLIGQGRMPNLEALLEHGARGVLQSVPPLISPALWTSLATGQPREVHGITNFLTKQPFSYREAAMTSAFRRAPALWNIAAGQGKKVAVVNWNAAFPAEAIPGGVFVAEGISPERINFSYIQPAAWVDKVPSLTLLRDPELEAKLSRWDHPVPAKAYDLDRLVATISREILKDERPDLMMVYFQHIDVISHGFWKYRWPMGLEYRYSLEPGEPERFGDVVESYYQFTDRLVGELVRAAAGYTVFVVSDHGFGPTYPPQNIFIALDHLLERLGFLAYEGATCEEMVAGLIREGVLREPERKTAGIFYLCQNLEPLARAQGLKAVAGELMRRGMLDREKLEPAAEKLAGLTERLARGHFREKVNWRSTQVFNIEDFHDPVQGLYLNLQGREPEGVVPEDRFESFRQEVCRALKRLRTENGLPVFVRAEPNSRKRKLPVGQEDPPDILVQFNREVLGREFIERGRGDQDPIPLAAILWSYSDVSGDHQPRGIWLVSGPATAGFEPLPAGIYDVAPTVLWFLGFPAGADMPGQVLTEAFAPEARARPVRYVESWTGLVPARVEGGAGALSEEKRAQFEALGYIQK